MSDFKKPVKNGGPTPTFINWTPEKLARFKRHHANALEGGKVTFIFDDHGFLVGYAKYLIEHLDSKFKPKG